MFPKCRPSGPPDTAGLKALHYSEFNRAMGDVGADQGTKPAMTVCARFWRFQRGWLLR
jgi:hypothetical protein